MKRGVLVVVAIAVVVAAAASAWWLLQNEPQPASERVKPTTPAMIAVAAERAPVPAVSPVNAAASAASTVTTPKPEQARRNESVTGEGRISGTAAGSGLSPGAEITVALFRAPEKEPSEGFFDEDARVASVTARADGSFEFGALPEGEYELTATTQGFVGRTSTQITATERDRSAKITLYPAGTVSGRVVDAAHDPVAGAQVFVARSSSQGRERSQGETRSLSTKHLTDAAGAFTMPSLRLSANGSNVKYCFVVRAEGYAPFLSDFIEPNAPPVEWVLGPGTVVSGTLLDASTGEGLADKQVMLAAEETPLLSTGAKTDAGGYFFISGAAPGHRIARLADENFVVTPETAKVTIAKDAPTTELVLRAARGGSVSGRVYDKDTGAGIAGVQITAFLPSQSVESARRATSRADGTYRIAGLAASSYNVSCEAPDGYPKSSRSDRSQQVTAAPGSAATGVDFALSHGTRVFGTVVDETGKGVQGASVRGYSTRRGTNDWVESKADGSFVLGGFSPGQRVNVSGDKDGFAVTKIEPSGEEVVIQDQDVQGVRIVLSVESMISGVVVDANGKPREKMYLAARPTGSGKVGFSSGDESDATGKFEIKGLAPGEYQVSAMSRGVVENKSGVKVKLAKGEKVTGLRVVASGGGEEVIMGRVESTRGKPIANARVMAFGASGFDLDAASKEDGGFELSGLLPGKYQVSVRHDDYSFATPITVEAGTKDVRVVLKDQAVIEGRVLSAAGGQPVTSFNVSAEGETPQDLFFAMNDDSASDSFHDADGKFRLQKVHDGTTSIKVSAEGFAEATVKIPRVSAGETRREVMVRLDPGATLNGVVKNARGEPVAGAQIFAGERSAAFPAMDFQAGRVGQATSALDGTFKLTSLAPGQVTVAATHETYATKKVKTNVAVNAENHVEIVLGAGGVIEGMVTLDGKPLQDQHVTMFSINGGSAEDNTDANGHYRLDGLSAGSVRVSVDVETDGSERGKSEQVTVQEGAASNLDFAFNSGNCAIEGTVFEAEGTPVKNSVTIQLAMNGGPIGGETYSAQTDASGHYTFTGLPPGKAQLMVEQDRDNAMAMSRKAVTVDLAPKQRVRQDIFLFGGSTVHVKLTGKGANSMMVPVALLSGKIDMSSISMESFMEEPPGMVGTAMAMTGEAVFKGVAPGTYTLMAIILDMSKIGTSPEKAFDPSNFVTKVIEVEKDKELTVELGL